MTFIGYIRLFLCCLCIRLRYLIRIVTIRKCFSKHINGNDDITEMLRCMYTYTYQNDGFDLHEIYTYFISVQQRFR